MHLGKQPVPGGLSRCLRQAGIICAVCATLSVAACGGGGGGGGDGLRQPPPGNPGAPPRQPAPAQPGLVGLVFRPMALGAPRASDGRNYRTAEFMGHWGLAAISADGAYQRGYFGQGVTIAVADDGGDPTHPDLMGRIVAPRHVVSGTANVFEPNTGGGIGHGTYVALLAAAARGNSGSGFEIAVRGGSTVPTTNVHGVAPQARVMPIALTGGGSPQAALQHAVSNGASVINFSIGVAPSYIGRRVGQSGIWLIGGSLPAFRPTIERGLGFGPSLRASFNEAARILENADIVAVFAAGNEGWNSMNRDIHLCGKNNLTEPGCALGTVRITRQELVDTFTWLPDPRNPSVSVRFRDMWGTGCGRANCAEYNSPGGWKEAPYFEHGLLGKWLTVGALLPSGSIAPFSNGCGAARNWCLFAPGENLTVDRSANGIGGTSFAAPIVSGALAVLKSRLPSMPMEVVQAVLLVSADPLGSRVSNPNEPDDVYGWGRVNLSRAVAMQGTVRLPYSQPDTGPVTHPLRLRFRSTALGNPRASDGQNYRTAEFMGHWGLAAIAADGAYQRGYFGRGVTIAVADTGMDTTHPDVTGRIVAPWDISNGSANVFESNAVVGHGTVVALVAAGARGNAGSNFQIAVRGSRPVTTTNVHGVAPEASIMPITRTGGATYQQAIHHAISNGAQVLNFSSGAAIPYVGRRVGENGFWFTDELIAFRPIIEGTTASGMGFRQDFGEAALLLDNQDIVVVWGSGNNYWNSISNRVGLCGRNNVSESGCPLGQVEITAEQFMETFQWLYDRNDPSRTLRFRDMWGTACGRTNCAEYNSPGGWAEAPFFQPELLGKWLVVGALDRNGEISDFSNGCGAARNWCLVAPGEGLVITSDPDGISGTSLSAPLVSGALAVLKSRLRAMPMEVLQAMLLVSADPLGSRVSNANQPDEIYGWGRLNLGRAIAMQGTVSLPYSEVQTTTTSTSTQQATTSTSTQAVPLLGTRVTLSPALSHAARQMQAVEVAVSGVGHAHYNMPLSALAVVETARQPVLGHAAWDMLTPAGGWHIAGPGGYGPFVEWAGRGDVRATGLGAGSMNAWAMHANYMHRGGLGAGSADSIYSGGLHAIGMDLSLGSLGRWRVRHELCGDCEGSVWREWSALAPAGPSVTAPFFADAGGAVALYMPGSGLRPFVAASSGRETRQAPWRQFGVRWLGEGKRLLSALELSLVDESRSVWGARFGALANARTRTWQGRLFLSAPLGERWRGLFHYERAAGEVSVARGMVSGISGLWAEGWSVGLEGREVFREEDTLRFFVRQDTGVRGGHMRIDHYVAQGSFVDAFYRRRPQSLEQRQTVIDLRGVSRLHYALGYSRPLGKRTRLASGLEYVGQSKGIGVSLQLQVTF